jgi:hypothetical protein
MQGLKRRRCPHGRTASPERRCKLKVHVVGSRVLHVSVIALRGVL